MRIRSFQASRCQAPTAGYDNLVYFNLLPYLCSSVSSVATFLFLPSPKPKFKLKLKLKRSKQPPYLPPITARAIITRMISFVPSRI